LPEYGHVPVLPAEVLAALSPEPGQTYLDCTAGLGGHAAAVAERLGSGGRVVLCDLDPGNLERAAAKVREAMGGAAEDRLVVLRSNFAHAPAELRRRGLSADLVLADLGFASTQVDDPERGLSFRADGPLDMRLDPNAPVTAEELVNTLPERELERAIRSFGEDPNARRIARNIVAVRKQRPITSTGQLAEVVRSAVPASQHGRIDPATRTFQALRIAVNDEIGSLESLLAAVRRAAETVRRGEPAWLAPGAKVAVIAFHSLEDRPVKRAFADLVRGGLAEAITKGVVEAGEEEIARNPRSRSAKLRAVRIGGGPGGAE